MLNFQKNKLSPFDIEKTYYLVVDSRDIKIKHNICYICGYKITDPKIAISGNQCSLAHCHCISENGFVGLLTKDDFKSIIRDCLEEQILDNLED